MYHSQQNGEIHMSKMITIRRMPRDIHESLRLRTFKCVLWRRVVGVPIGQPGSYEQSGRTEQIHAQHGEQALLVFARMKNCARWALGYVVSPDGKVRTTSANPLLIIRVEEVL